MNIYEDVMFIKNFIVNHSMRITMCNEIMNLKLLSIAVEEIKLIKGCLRAMMISDCWP